MSKNLIIDTIKFILWTPNLEVEEFHPMIKEHSKEIFGKDTFYLDISLRLKSEAGLGSEPDGFVIDPVNERLYVVEVELSKHNPYNHINVQLTSFINGLENLATKNKVVDVIFDEIENTPSLKGYLEEKIKQNLYKWLKNLLSKPPIIVVVIEERTKPVEEACRLLMKSYDTKILEFQTFRREDAPTVHAHLFESLFNAYYEPTPSPKTKPTNHETHADVQTGNSVEIELINLSEKKYAAFHLDKNVRRFFPAYKVGFILETDIGEIKTVVRRAGKKTEMGDPIAGRYIQGGLTSWFKKHPQVDIGTKVRFECIEPHKRYRLSLI